MLLKTVAIIQARMQSSRLPGKVLADVAGRPMLQHVVDRARRAVNLDAVVVATSDRTADDCVAEFCEGAGVGCYRGSRDDVLDRYFRAAEHFAAQTIVRLTADCPLLDPGVIDRVVEKFRAGAFDYVSNTIGCTYPDGLDTEVISRAALERAWNEAELRSEREHVTAYVVNHSELFRLGCVRHELDLSALRWTVDHPADLEFVRAVYDACGPGPFAMKEVLQLLRRQPQLSEINRGIARNEGYSKSLHEDSLVGGPKSR